MMDKDEVRREVSRSINQLADLDIIPLRSAVRVWTGIVLGLEMNEWDEYPDDYEVIFDRVWDEINDDSDYR